VFWRKQEIITQAEGTSNMEHELAALPTEVTLPALTQRQILDELTIPISCAVQGLNQTAICYLIARLYDVQLARIVLTLGLLVTYYVTCLHVEDVALQPNSMFRGSPWANWGRVTLMVPFYFARLYWINRRKRVMAYRTKVEKKLRGMRDGARVTVVTRLFNWLDGLDKTVIGMRRAAGELGWSGGLRRISAAIGVTQAPNMQANGNGHLSDNGVIQQSNGNGARHPDKTAHSAVEYGVRRLLSFG
jgi:hypothetical protein